MPAAIRRTNRALSVRRAKSEAGREIVRIAHVATDRMRHRRKTPGNQTAGPNGPNKDPRPETRIRRRNAGRAVTPGRPDKRRQFHRRDIQAMTKLIEPAASAGSRTFGSSSVYFLLQIGVDPCDRVANIRPSRRRNDCLFQHIAIVPIDGAIVIFDSSCRNRWNLRLSITVPGGRRRRRQSIGSCLSAGPAIRRFSTCWECSCCNEECPIRRFRCSERLR